ncbi:MAG TPA: hypothetical protein VH044_04650 [Polyangiaceae bacterium]|nr:hypothetical protein [Polyangiaceae bacterium]
MPLLCVTAACLSGETVDLGAEYDASAPPIDAPSIAPPETSVDADPPESDAGDGGAEADAPPEATDEPTPPGAYVCIPNPSFEMGLDDGAAVSSPEVAVPGGWQSCPLSSSTPPTSCVLPPTNGRSYLALSLGFLINPASIDVLLCEPLAAGVTYTLAADIAIDAPLDDSGTAGEPPVLQVRASDTACDAQGALLVRFAGSAGSCGWRSVCGTFTTTESYSHLMLVPETGSAGAVFAQTHLLVDNLTSPASCASP